VRRRLADTKRCGNYPAPCGPKRPSLATPSLDTRPCPTTMLEAEPDLTPILILPRRGNPSKTRLSELFGDQPPGGPAVDAVAGRGLISQPLPIRLRVEL